MQVASTRTYCPNTTILKMCINCTCHNSPSIWTMPNWWLCIVLLPTFQEAKLANTNTLCKGAFAHVSFLWQHQTPLTKVVCVCTAVRNFTTLFGGAAGQQIKNYKHLEIISIVLKYAGLQIFPQTKSPSGKIKKKLNSFSTFSWIACSHHG